MGTKSSSRPDDLPPLDFHPEKAIDDTDLRDYFARLQKRITAENQSPVRSEPFHPSRWADGPQNG